MFDSDLAELYDVETNVLNQAVKRNIARFPEDVRYHLYVIQKIERGLKDAEEGSVYDEEEMKKVFGCLEFKLKN